MKNEKRQAFYPGKVWLDTEGKRIQAHGGSVMYIDGVYYWYGENKEKTDGVNGVGYWGVRCYKSTDRIIGKIAESSYRRSRKIRSLRCIRQNVWIDRILFIIERTKKYVCWLKVMDTFDIQSQ